MDSEKPHFPATEKPQYPVIIDPNPTFTKVIRNLTFGERCGITSVGVIAYGAMVKGGRWDMGKTFVAATLGTGSFLIYRNSRNRLMGFPKDESIKLYPVIDPNPPITKVLRNFNFIDYCTIAASTGYPASIGYRCLLPHKVLALPVLSGFFGLLGGLGIAYHESEGRLKGVLPNNGEVSKYQKQGLQN